jgi:hypothetical protein
VAEEFLNSSEDVDEILKIAIRKSAVGGDELRYRLEQSASELGIPAEALVAAEREHRIKKMLVKYKRAQAAAFNYHLVPYVMVNLLLVIIWATTMGLKSGFAAHFWPIYPIFGWGIGMASHAFAAFRRVDEDDPAFLEWLKERDPFSGTMSNGTIKD